jgi:hypothetical protein
MDILEINFTVIPKLAKLFFPAVLLGEEVYFRKDSHGYMVRLNKDLSPNDINYTPNRVINISPSDQLKRIKSYFDLSYFTPKQLTHIFSRLDDKCLKFENIPLDRMVSYDTMKIKFELIEKDLKSKKEELLNNYKIVKDELLRFSPVEVQEISEPKFKTKLTVDELAYLFKLMIEQEIIVLDKNQKTKFFDFIATNFQSKDKVNISPNSIRNKSYDPSFQTIDKIHTDLLQMSQLAYNHKRVDKIEWEK